ncbi:MAG: endo-1,4-beta-xylanase [Fimbriimonadaceae bacterium]|nr:endo-1,4-beta-xylanase [Fimbriimonadaceae bacterium]
MLLRSVCWLLATALATFALSQQVAPLGGERLILNDSLGAYEVGTHPKGKSRIVDVQGMPFRQAIQIEVAERGMQWDAEVGRPIPRSFKIGEVLLMRVFMREVRSLDESGMALANIQVAMRREPWSAPISRVVTVDGGWQEFWIPGRISSDFGPDDLFIKLSCGEVRQTLEIGGLELWVYPAGTRIESLPRTVGSYTGREASAPWRLEAQKRIEALRTAPLEIKLINQKGQAIAGRSVKVEMVRPAFEFGCALPARSLLGPENDATRQRFLSLFNAGSFENDTKWPAWLCEFGPDIGKSHALEALKWFQQNNLAFRGHVLVWPGYRNLPAFVQPGPNGPLSGETMHRLALSHIDEILGATKGFVQEWDVLNEPRDNHDIMDAAGRQVMVEWFKRAHERAPGVRLALNDYSILPSRHNTVAIQEYERNVKFLLQNKAPLSVLGFQGHMGGSFNDPRRLIEILNQFAVFNLPIRVTEFTLIQEDEELAHDYARDFLIAMYSHPSVIGVQTWGMRVMFRPDGQFTGPGRAWNSLIRQEWWTTGSGKTSSAGFFSLRCHLGRYKVTVDGQEFFLDLAKGSAPFTLTVR